MASLRSGRTMKHKEKACESCKGCRRNNRAHGILALPSRRISRLRAATAAQAGGGPCHALYCLFNESSKHRKRLQRISAHALNSISKAV